MPFAVFHVVLTGIFLALFRNKFIKNKFPFYFVVIGAIAGLVPDVDIIIFYLLSFFGYGVDEIHRTYTHSIFLPLLFLVLGNFFYIRKKRSSFRFDLLFFVISFGIFIHIILDVLFSYGVRVFYPFSSYLIGLDIFGFIPKSWNNTFLNVVDGVILVLWLVYITVKKKITDFV